MTTSKQQAKEIARALDRRKRIRWLLLIALLVAIGALAIGYLKCGPGFGLGGGGGLGLGKGEGSGSGTSTATVPSASISAMVDAGLRRCSVRVSARGILLEGETSTVESVVASCKKAGTAEVVVTGDARQGDWDALRTALENERIRTFVSGTPSAASSDAGR